MVWQTLINTVHEFCTATLFISRATQLEGLSVISPVLGNSGWSSRAILGLIRVSGPDLSNPFDAAGHIKTYSRRRGPQQ